MILLRVEDNEGNGFALVPEHEAYDFFKIEGARCWHCGTMPVVVRRLRQEPDKPTAGEVVLCECGERFGVAWERGRAGKVKP